MNKYDTHFLMNTEDIKVYAKEKLNFFDLDEDIDAIEIGDGNINYVFKVYSKNRNRSIVIKQADKSIRSSGRTLDINRNKIEAEILKIEKILSPNYVPEIYHYDENMYALCMEDISEYKNLRKELFLGKTFKDFANHITNFLVDTLLPTTDLVLNRFEKKENVKKFTNIELCDISEDLVLTEPYYNYKNRNIITEQNLQFVEESLYSNKKLKCEIAKLKDRFMNCSQSLIHGDLHSGSIFINENGMKVIDPEFAFYGPIGYDVGNVIGNLFFAYANKHYTDKNNLSFLQWIENTISDIVDMFLNKFSKKYDELVMFPLYRGEFKDYYIKQIISDSFGYAGTEIIRRVVGDSKVLEVVDIECLETKIKLEKTLIRFGISLIINRENFDCGEDIIRQFKILL